MSAQPQLALDVAVTGGWWCRRCTSFVIVLDEGEHNQRCPHGHYAVEWKDPVAVTGPKTEARKKAEVKVLRKLSISMEAAAVIAGTVVKHTPEYLEKKPKLRKEDRNLRELAYTGYYFCFGCLEISQLDESSVLEAICTLCGSEDIRWQEPAFERTEQHETHTVYNRPTPAVVTPTSSEIHIVDLSSASQSTESGFE